MGSGIGGSTMFSLVRMNIIKIFMECSVHVYILWCWFIFFNIEISVTSLQKIRLLLWETPFFKLTLFDLETYLNSKNLLRSGMSVFETSKGNENLVWKTEYLKSGFK